MRRFIVLDGSNHYIGQSFETKESAEAYCSKVAGNTASSVYFVAEIISKLESSIKVITTDLRE